MKQGDYKKLRGAHTMVGIAGVSHAEDARTCGGIAQSTVPFLQRKISCHTSFFPLLHCCSSSEGDIIVHVAVNEVMALICLCCFGSVRFAPQSQLRAIGLQIRMFELANGKGRTEYREGNFSLNIFNQRSIPGNLV